MSGTPTDVKHHALGITGVLQSTVFPLDTLPKGRLMGQQLLVFGGYRKGVVQSRSNLYHSKTKRCTRDTHIIRNFQFTIQVAFSQKQNGNMLSSLDTAP
jgi:hypothetical protein